jgi:gluconokinase
MHAGIPLDDADRSPWLQSLQDAIAGWLARPESVVLACSALKENYRQQLLGGPEVKLVFLHADFNCIAERLAARRGHYMNPALLKSQFDTLEVPREAISVDVSGPISDTVAAVRAALGV